MSVQAAGLDLSTLLGNVTNNRRGGLVQGLTDQLQSGECQKLKAWAASAAQVTAESGRGGTPGDDASGRTTAGSRAMASPNAQLAWLISDPVFVAQFGKPYDQLTTDELREHQKTHRPLCQRLGLFTPAEAQLIDRAWNPGSHIMLSRQLAQDRQRQAAAEQRIQAAQSEAQSLQHELGALTPDETGLTRLRAIVQRVDGVKRSLPDGERRALDDALSAAIAQVGVAAQRARVATALKETRGPEELATLWGLRSSVTDHADPPGSRLPASDASLAALDRRVDTLVQAAAEQERRAMTSFGDGTAALHAGAAWHRGFVQRWGNRALPPGLLSVLEDFHARRQVWLQSPAVAAELRALVERSASVSEAQMLRDRHFIARPQETSSPAFLAVESALQARVQRAERNLALGRPDTNEPAPAAARTQAAATSTPPAPQRSRPVAAAQADETSLPGEPSEEVMYDLVRTKFENAAERIRNIQQQCSRGGGGAGGGGLGAMMDAMICLSMGMGQAGSGGTLGQAEKITRFRKIGCARADGRPGFVCDYEITTAHPMNKQFGSIYGGLMDEGGMGQARFVKSSDGWIGYWRGGQK